MYVCGLPQILLESLENTNKLLTDYFSLED